MNEAPSSSHHSSRRFFNPSIRLKTQMIFFSSFLFVFLCVYFSVRFFLLNEYKALDEQIFSRDGERLQTALDQSSSRLISATKDYAYWDDSYAFIETKNPEFVQSSLSVNSFISNHFNYLRYENLNGEVVYERNIDLTTQTDTPTSLLFQQYIQSLKSTEEVSGFVQLGDEVYLISHVPVRDSALQKPADGYLIFALKVDEGFVNSVTNTTKTAVRIASFGEKLGNDFQQVKVDGIKASQAATQDNLVSYLKMPSLQSAQAPYIIFESPRTFYLQGIKTLRQFALILFGTFIFMNIPIFFALELFVNRPISRLSHSVNRFVKSKGTERISVVGSGEVADLAENINNMLDEIQQLTNQEKSQEEEIGREMIQLQSQNSELTEARESMATLLGEEKSLEDEIKQERDRAEAIINSMGEGLLTFDKESRFTIINPAAEKLLEISAAEAIGKKWSDVLTTLKGNEVIMPEELTFRKTMSTGEVVVTPIEADHYYRTLKGKVFPVASITAPLKSGDVVIGAVKVFRDVSIEKEQNAIIERSVQERTQEISEKNVALQKARDDISKGWFDLQEEKARLTASISSLALGFILTDSKENIVMMNPVANQILNLQEGIREFEHIEDILKDACDLHELHLKCETEKKTIEKKDLVFGSKFLRIFLAPIISTAKGSEELIGTVLLLEDTTEAKVLDRSKDEFFSIASHELRTPLTAIRGNTSMILDLYKDKLQDKELEDMLTDINTSSIRLIEIVNDFLSVSRLEQGSMEFKQEQVDVVVLINQIFDELKVIADQTHIAFKLEDTSSEPLLVIADHDKTKEVLINLIGNGLKFTEKGEIGVSVRAEGDFLKIFVRDTGRGITPQFQNLLFRKFQQAGESLLTRDTTKGTGLGLYISKLMVEGMGGRIWLERSEAGVGTVFGFTLPKPR